MACPSLACLVIPAFVQLACVTDCQLAHARWLILTFDNVTDVLPNNLLLLLTAFVLFF